MRIGSINIFVLLIATVACAETNCVEKISRDQIEKAWYQVKHATNDTQRAAGLDVVRCAAAENDPRAESLTGFCHEMGIGVERDLEKAYEWYLRSAEHGRADSQMKVAYLTETLKNDITNAVIWYKRAAEAGNARAQCNLANCLRLGRGVEQDGKAAIEWYKESAVQGDEDAQYNLAVCCYKGLYCEKDDAVALRLFRESARRGHKGALDALNQFGIETDVALTNGVLQTCLDLEAFVRAIQQKTDDVDDGKSTDMSAAVCERIRGYLDDFGVRYTYETTGEIVRCIFTVGGKIGQMNYVLQCDKAFVRCYMILPIRADETRRDEMAKLLTRLNYRECEFSYDMDFEDGEIRLKTSIATDVVLRENVEALQDPLTAGARIVLKGFDSILGVALGLKTAEEASREE